MRDRSINNKSVNTVLVTIVQNIKTHKLITVLLSNQSSDFGCSNLGLDCHYNNHNNTDKTYLVVYCTHSMYMITRVVINTTYTSFFAIRLLFFVVAFDVTIIVVIILIITIW